MKQITRMATLGVFLLAGGVSGTALANGTSAPEPEPVRYMPPPPAPVPAPVVDTGDEGFYISGAVGIGIPEDLKCSGSQTANGSNSRMLSTSQQTAQNQGSDKIDMDTGLALNGAIGYDFGDARLEAAVGYQSHDVADSESQDGDISLLTVMANAYYDIDTGSDITPYLMAGAGLAHVDPSGAETDNVFAWQVGAGLGFKVAEGTTLDLGYRYLKPNKFDTGNGRHGKLAVHNVMLGLRYNLF